MEQTTVWINGERHTDRLVYDRALHYGDGLFETIRVHAGRPRFLARHLQRLRAGCERLRFPSLDWPGLNAQILAVSATAADSVLKVIVSRGEGNRGYRPQTGRPPTLILLLSAMPGWPSQLVESGVRAMVCKTRLCSQPQLAGIKHLNRLEQVLASAEWDDDRIQEGLMLDASERLIEGTRSNVFLVLGSKLVTPTLTACGVAGIMRSVVLDLARDIGLGTEIRPVRSAELHRASEVLLCNSVVGIWPVSTVDGYASYSVGAVTRALTSALGTCSDAEEGRWYSS
jgi:4-amino-4-deoxychorismate lyase